MCAMNWEIMAYDKISRSEGKLFEIVGFNVDQSLPSGWKLPDLAIRVVVQLCITCPLSGKNMRVECSVAVVFEAM